MTESGLDPLQCTGCGAPVPLGPGDVAACRRCDAEVDIPPEHVALRDAAEAAKVARRKVERMLEARLGRWVSPLVTRLYARIAIPVVVVGVPVIFGLTQSRMHWFAAEWVVLAGILPFMTMLLPWLVLWSYTTPGAYMASLGLALRPAPPQHGGRGFDCGACGAPLWVEAEALAATCDHCHCDSWVARLPAGVSFDAAREREARNLADLVAAREFRGFDVRLLLKVYPAVTAIVCLGLWFSLPGRRELRQFQYERSVGYAWALVGEPGPVVDLASHGDELLAVTAGGDLVVFRRGRWRTVARGSYAAVASNGIKALAVGTAGSASWFEGGSLAPADTGLDADLLGVSLSLAGDALVVGRGGQAARFSNGAWSRVEGLSRNDLEDAFLDSEGTHAMTAGGVTVCEARDLEVATPKWACEMLPGLPFVVSVVAAHPWRYVATTPADRPSTLIFQAYDDQPFLDEPITRPERIHDLAEVGDEVVAVGDAGAVGVLAGVWRSEPAPCQGTLRAVAFFEGQLVTGGDDGVFVRTEP